MEEDEKSDEEILFGAMLAAREEFKKHLEENCDYPEYFEIEFKGYILDIEFTRWKQIDLKKPTL